MGFRFFRHLSWFALASAVVLAGPASAFAADWTQFRYGASQSGSNPSETTLTPTTVGGLDTAWSAPVATEVLLASPLVVGDESIINGYPSTVAAFSTSTGAPIWSFGPDGRQTNPLAAGDGKVFEVGNPGPVYAIDATTGTEVWHRVLGGNTGGGPTVVGGVVFVPAGGRLFALDTATGVTKWRVAAGPGANNISTPAVAGGLVVVGTLDGVQAFDRVSGKIAWAYTYPKDYGGRGVAIVNGAVYTAAARTELKLDLASGAVLWKKTLPRGNVAGPAPAIGGGLVIEHVRTPQGEILTARSVTTGNVVWSVGSADGETNSSGSAAAIAHNVVYAGVSNGIQAFALSTGKPLWQATLDGISESSPSVANGQLEIATFPGTLYAFRLP